MLINQITSGTTKVCKSLSFRCHAWSISSNVFRITKEGHLEQVDTSSFLTPGNKILYDIYQDKDGKLWVSAFDVESFIIDIRDYIVQKYPLPDLRNQLRCV